MSKLRFVFLILILTPLLAAAVSKYEAIEPLLQRLDSKRAPPSVQEAAAVGLLNRLLPTHLSSFEFKIVPKDVCGGDSCFLINNHNKSSQNEPEITIRGTTAVEIASGLHWYLKYWCGAHVSWDKTGGIQTSSIPEPGSLPRLKGKGLKIKRPVPWNYYQNVVTSSCEYQNQLPFEQDISLSFLHTASLTENLNCCSSVADNGPCLNRYSKNRW